MTSNIIIFFILGLASLTRAADTQNEASSSEDKDQNYEIIMDIARRLFDTNEFATPLMAKDVREDLAKLKELLPKYKNLDPKLVAQFEELELLNGNLGCETSQLMGRLRFSRFYSQHYMILKPFLNEADIIQLNVCVQKESADLKYGVVTDFAESMMKYYPSQEGSKPKYGYSGKYDVAQGMIDFIRNHIDPELLIKGSDQSWIDHERKFEEILASEIVEPCQMFLEYHKALIDLWETVEYRKVKSSGDREEFNLLEPETHQWLGKVSSCKQCLFSRPAYQNYLVWKYRNLDTGYPSSQKDDLSSEELRETIELLIANHFTPNDRLYREILNLTQTRETCSVSDLERHKNFINVNRGLVQSVKNLLNEKYQLHLDICLKSFESNRSQFNDQQLLTLYRMLDAQKQNEPAYKLLMKDIHSHLKKKRLL